MFTLERDKNVKKKLCVFQINYNDKNRDLDTFNPIPKIKQSKVFDHIVLAAPNLEENKFLEGYAKKWGVELYLGDVENVTKRIYDTAKHYGCEIIARASIYWFFLDSDLIKRMVNDLEKTNSEFVMLPCDFDLRFGADVCNISFIEKMLTLFKDDKEIEKKFKFRPWAYPETNPTQIKILNFENLPVYSKDAFDKVLDDMKTVWPERADFSEAPVFPYQTASKYIKPSHRVLDAACGLGKGTAFLTKSAEEVVGVDYSEEAITECKKRYDNLKNIRFIQSDITELTYEKEYFDCIVSIHTMEHVPDEKKFLDKIWSILKPGGCFVLEVPILVVRPFKGIQTPINPYHIREYSFKELKAMVSRFKIIESYGVSRGFYVDISKMRNACMFVMKKEVG